MDGDGDLEVWIKKDYCRSDSFLLTCTHGGCPMGLTLFFTLLKVLISYDWLVYILFAKLMNFFQPARVSK